MIKNNINQKQKIYINYGYIINLEEKNYLLYSEMENNFDINLSKKIINIKNNQIFWEYEAENYIYLSINIIPDGINELKNLLIKKINVQGR